MAVKLNTEFNYKYQIEGNTPWERIKHLKSFLEGRIRAATGEEVAEIRRRADEAELSFLKESGAPEHVVLRAEAALLESDAEHVVAADAFERNREEIEILKRLLAEEYAIAEATRIPGYTDEQMFEVNAANEFTVMIAREIQAEIISYGRPSSARVRNAMSNPHTMQALQAVGLLPVEAKMLVSHDPSVISIKNQDGTPILLENKD